MESKNSSFSYLRGIFFPVHWSELKRFVPMALMMLFILINYTILRNVKDTLVVNAKGSDAEIISHLKFWGTLPCAFLFMLVYSKLNNFMSRDRIFYFCLVPFLVFFGAFSTIIYPNIDLLHPDPAYVAHLKESLPNFKWFIAIWGNWSYSVFYVLSELWGSVILSLLFWQFANDIVKKDQTKRFYPLFGMVANVGLIFAGLLMKYCATGLDGSMVPWGEQLNCLMPCIVISGMAIAALFYYVSQDCKKDDEVRLVQESAPKKSKPKLSLKESFILLITSRHLLCVALIVLSYGISINYVEVLWKGQIKAHFAGDETAYANFMASFSITTGLIAIPMMLIGGNILRALSWRKAALITPTILLVTGLGFFSLILAGNYYGDPGAVLFSMSGVSVTFLGLAVQFGLLQNALTKATKYSLFDPTKEMAYIPLSEDFKTKGKAAVDVVGSRLGKGGGALTFVIINFFLPAITLPQLVPLLACLTIGLLLVWIASVYRLDTSIKALEAGADPMDAPKQPEAVPANAVRA